MILADIYGRQYNTTDFQIRICGLQRCQWVTCYKKFEVDSVKWHYMEIEARMKHAERFRIYKPTLDEQFDKPKSENRMIGSGPESQISKVRLTG